MIPADHPSTNQDSPGGGSSGAPVYLMVGKLRRPHGIRGEMQMEVLTDFPERLQVGVQVLVGESHIPLRIRSQRWHNQVLLLAFEGLKTPEAGGEFRNQFVYVLAEDRPSLPEGEYYHHQLLGLTVVNEDGQRLGKLEEILTTGANDVYLVRLDNGSELLLPAIHEVILEINLEQSQMKVHLLPGLQSE